MKFKTNKQDLIEFKNSTFSILDTNDSKNEKIEQLCNLINPGDGRRIKKKTALILYNKYINNRVRYNDSYKFNSNKYNKSKNKKK